MITTTIPSTSLSQLNDVQPAPKVNHLQPNDPHLTGTQFREVRDAATAQEEAEEAPAPMSSADLNGSTTKVRIPLNHWR
jgi:hypothetical protein